MTDQSSVISMWAFITSWFSPTASLFLLLNIVIGTVALNFRSQKKSQKQKQEQGLLGRDDSTQLARAPSFVERLKSFNVSSPYRSDSQNSQPEYEPAVDQRQEQEQGRLGRDDSTQLARAPSFVERVKSNVSSLYRSNSQNSQPEYEPAVDQRQEQEQGRLGRDDSTQLARAPSLVERVKSFNLASLYRSDSENSQPENEPAVDQRPAPQEEKSCRVCEQRAMRGKSDKGREVPVRQAKKMKKSASERSMVAGHLEFEEEEEEEEELERRRPATTRMEKTESFGGGDEGVDGKADDFISRFRQQQRLDYLLL